MTRSRTKSNLKRAEGLLQRAEGLYFEDCGLIIRAETTLFRISRDFLAARSLVFEGMLSLPPPRDAEKMDGCPFVHLPDSAEDITAFLKALVYSESFEPYPAPTSFSMIASVLRMSHKYEVDVLRKRALVHLSEVHPLELHAWELIKHPLFSSPPEPTSLEVALLARQTSAIWVLPTAFYRIYEVAEESDIVHGIESGALGPADKVACIRAIRWLETAGTSKILEFLWAPLEMPGCYGGTRCSDSRIKTRIAAEAWRASDPGTASFLPLTLWGADDWERLDVCRICLRRMKATHAEAKQCIWDKLPELFGLPNWTELARLKTEALA
ncbi:hypothetical protein FB451DRAFT_1048603 [Mycena latifolia]|nr:hypothetical protein FB451DRAFT_1048603 [Mycena latifolia]